jgi:WD40 repeat protein
VAPQQPYVGPRPFRREDRGIFFGRDSEAADLACHVVANATVILYSRSGAGKTSLINAKLVELLEADGCDVLPIARVHGPLKDVDADSIRNVYVWHTLQSWLPEEKDAPTLVKLTLRDFLAARKQQVKNRPAQLFTVVVFDQFEELFSAHPSRWKDRKTFFEDIRSCLAADSGLRVLFSMREDRIAELDPYVGLLPEKARTRIRLERLREAAALLAITSPLAGTGRKFAPGVAERLVRNLLEVPVDPRHPEKQSIVEEFVEPVQLQVVCQSLWQHLPAGVTDITCAHLDRWGNVNQALVRFYEMCIKTVAAEVKLKPGVLRRWFETALITPEGTRGIVYRGATESGWIPNAAAELLEQLHIIRSEPRAGATWYELTHDRLIEPIRTANREWIGKRAGAEALRQRLQDAAVRWAQGGRGAEHLLQEVDLVNAERWLKSRAAMDLGYSDKIRSLVDASRAAVDGATRALELTRAEAFAREQASRAEAERARAEEQSRRAESERLRAREMKRGLTLVAVLFLAALAFAVIGWLEQRKAEIQEASAHSRELAAHAVQNLDKDPQLALLLAVNAAQIAHTEQATDALRQAYRADLAARQIAVLGGQKGIVWKAGFTPDGQTLISVGADSAVHLWNTLTWTETKALVGHGGPIDEFDISKAGEYLATEAADGTARIWSLGTGRHVSLPGLGGPFSALAFSPDGTLMVTETSTFDSGNPDSGRWEATLWSTREPVSALVVLRGHTDAITSVAFAPDGQAFVTASEDGTARIWNVKSPSNARVLRGHGAAINSAVFSPDSKVVLTASDDGTVRTWNPSNGRPLSVVTTSGGAAGMATFSPDGRLFAAVNRRRIPRDSLAARNGTRLESTGPVTQAAAPTFVTRVWVTETYEVAADLPGHTDDIYAVRFSRDGKLLASAGADGTSRVWETRSWMARAVLQGHSGPIHSVDFNGDGSRLATASHDGTVRVWDTTPQAVMLTNGALPIVEVAFLRERSQALSVDLQGVATVWDTASGGQHSVKGDPVKVIDAALAPDKDLVALLTAATRPDSKGPRRLIVRTVTSGAIVLETASPASDRLEGSVAISPDGRFLAATNGSARRLFDRLLPTIPGAGQPAGLVWIWSVAARQVLHTMSSPQLINDAHFSPEGERVLTSSEGGEARITNVRTGATVGAIRGQGGPIRKGVFNGTGTSFAIANLDGTVEVWDVEPTPWRRAVVLKGHTGSVFDMMFDDAGKFLVTASFDNTVRVWDVATGQQLVQVSSGVSNRFLAVAMRGDGKFILTTDTSAAAAIIACAQCSSGIELLPLAKERVRRDFTPEERHLYLHENVSDSAGQPASR